MVQASLEFVGTATTVLRLGPFTVLTDPNFLHRGQRAYLGRGLFSRRLTEPSLQAGDLPPLDAVVLSHLHGDHFDRIARRDLDRRPPLFTTKPAARRLARWGFGSVAPLATWESHELSRDGFRLRVTSVPGQHAPGPARHVLPQVMGTVLELFGEGADPFRVYVSGDTLFRPWLGEIVERTGPLDAAVVHLGGTRILGLTVTMDARQGVDLVELLHPAVTVPVHYDDYRVFRSPLRDFVELWEQRGPGSCLRVVPRGQEQTLTPPART